MYFILNFFTKNKPYGNNQSFGYVLLFILTIVYYFYNINNIFEHIIFLIVGIVIVLITYLKPNLFDKPNKMWTKVGLLLGNFTNILVLTLMFIILFIPIGAVLRAFKVLSISDRYDNKLQSYWIKRKDPINTMKDQF